MVSTCYQVLQKIIIMPLFFCVYGTVNISHTCLSSKEIDIPGCEIDNPHGHFYKIHTYTSTCTSLVSTNTELRYLLLSLNLNS